MTTLRQDITEIVTEGYPKFTRLIPIVCISGIDKCCRHIEDNAFNLVRAVHGSLLIRAFKTGIVRALNPKP